MQLASQSFARCSRLFGALGSESGLKIFVLLGKTKMLCVSQIAREVGLSMSATSHQLRQLEASGLVRSIRKGRTICYLLAGGGVNNKLLDCARRTVGAGAKGRE
jgi:DNA-binding transcriptional ArsR family regulator